MGKTNAEILADIAEQNMREENDGKPTMRLHLGHLGPDDLNSEVDTTPRVIVDWSAGTPIWEKIPMAGPRTSTFVEDPSVEDSSR